MMNISLQIEAVYRRALLLRRYATESPVQPDLLDKALDELYFVLEELQTSQEELHHQNHELLATRQAIEQERQRYQALFELAPNGYLVTDRQGKICQANRAAVRLFDIPRDYLMNKPLGVLIAQSDRPAFLARLTQLESGSDWKMSLNSRNSKTTTLNVCTTLINDVSGSQQMVLWSLHDITVQHQLEQQLQSAQNELEKRVEVRTAQLSKVVQHLQQEINERQLAQHKIRQQAALLDIASDAIFVENLTDGIVFWSKGAERLYGWTAEEATGKTSGELLYDRLPLPVTSTFNPTFLHQTLELGSWQDELEQVTQAGTPIIVASRGTLVRDELGQPQSILVVNTDITEKKQRDAQLERAQRLDMLGSLASGISHDLQNVFSPILLTAQNQLMRSNNLDEKTQKSWKLVETTAKHGADLVKQILQFAKGTQSQKVPLKIDELLLEVAQTLERTFPKSIDICIELPSQPLDIVCANPTQVQQIVMNLCINARDAMPEGGTIRLCAENRQIDAAEARRHLDARLGNYVTISIADTGTGIPASFQDRIFEPFFTTKEPTQGTGLGLSMVLNLTQNQGGFVEFQTQVGKGTCFRVSLPTAICD